MLTGILSCSPRRVAVSLTLVFITSIMKSHVELDKLKVLPDVGSSSKGMRLTPLGRLRRSPTDPGDELSLVHSSDNDENEVEESIEF